MSENPATIADLIKVNSLDVADTDVSDVLNKAPVLRALASDIASAGTTHKYLRQDTDPSVGFRSENDGREHSKVGNTVVSVDLKIMDASFHIDKSIADAYRRGGEEAYMALAAKHHLQSAFFAAEKQIFYGTTEDAKGFSGIIEASNLDQTTDAQVVAAGGTTALTSVYAIRSVDSMTDTAIITGNDGNIEVGEMFEQFVKGSAGLFPAYCQSVTGWLGLQLGSTYSIARLANIDATTKGLTDDLLATLIALFPSSSPPTMLVMSMRSKVQLQASRTATGPTGAPAPFPIDSFDIPIITSDAISNAETKVVAQG